MMVKTKAEKKISDIVSQWFYTDSLNFAVCSLHSIVPNPAITVPFRSGKKRIEFSPELVEKFSDTELSFYLNLEITRILLGHPYQRKPYNAKPLVLAMSSDAVIWQLNTRKRKTDDNEYSKLPGVQYLKQMIGPHTTFCDMNFEQWYKYILDIVVKAKNAESAGTTDNEGLEDLASMSELWEEDEEALNDIKNDIEDAIIKEGYGKDGGEIERAVCDSVDFSFDYRRALSKFRQNVISPNRKLTRMRPSRRYGFKAMGSRYERKANILIAVDVSGSITDESFEHFIHAVKNFFFLGIIENIDLIFFDVNLKLSKPISYKKKIDLNEIKGRGGTNFQIPCDFYAEHKSDYSGMIIFTDGEGESPVIEGSSNVLWILDSRLNYEKSRQWITKVCGCQATFLPF